MYQENQMDRFNNLLHIDLEELILGKHKLFQMIAGSTTTAELNKILPYHLIVINQLKRQAMDSRIDKLHTLFWDKYTMLANKQKNAEQEGIQYDKQTISKT